MRLRVEGYLRLLLWCVLLGSAVWAHALTAVPPLSGRMIDQTDTLSAEQQRVLEQRLRAFEEKKGSQIAVLIVSQIGDEAIESFSMRVAERWKLGRRKIDDGAILIVVKDQRQLRIEVGYGLEGVLNDATSKRIIEELMVPAFRRGDFEGGISAGVDAMMRVIEGEPLPAPPVNAVPQPGASDVLPLVFFMALIIGGLTRAWLGRAKGALVAGGLLGMGAWWLSGLWMLALLSAVVGLLITLVGGRMGHGWQGGRHQGGFNRYGGAGHDGHGWDGFRGGGGGFGGGGASGKW